MSSLDLSQERVELFRLYAALPLHVVRKLLRRYPTATAAWEAYPEWGALGIDEKDRTRAGTVTRARAVAAMERLQRSGVAIVTPDLPGYPSPLASLDRMPPLLFIRGAWEPMDEGAVSLVGTRRCTPYGEGVTRDLASALAREGITVVSGLARGIDGVAHRAALEAGGRTVAVLAAGPDRIYPPEHRELARSIEERGALLTEFAPGTGPEPYHFPDRNRIIAALSLITVVVEAGDRSGALITARLADGLSRQVFAVPGPLGRPQSRGCHRLIQDGAALLGSVEELLEAARRLREPLRQQALPGMAPPGMTDADAAGLPPRDPQRWLYELLDREPRTLEELIRRSGGDVGAVQAGLGLLELRGLAVRVGGRYWRRRW